MQYVNVSVGYANIVCESLSVSEILNVSEILSVKGVGSVWSLRNCEIESVSVITQSQRFSFSCYLYVLRVVM